MLRFDLPCEALGLSVPPVPVQLRFLGGPRSWTALVVVPAGGAEGAAVWMRSHGASRVTTARGIAPRTLRCEFDAMPKRWLAWLQAARIVQVDVGDAGVATMFVQGTPQDLAALAASLATEPQAVRQRVSSTRGLDAIEITPRQLEVLCNAVAMGYYDVPHRISLRRLGSSMGLSVSAASQLLRRAQAQIIRGFIDANTLDRGQRAEGDATPKPPKGG